MVQKMTVVLEDDVDGDAAAETVAFALDGVSYDIDLSASNAEKLRAALAPWVGHARRVGGRKSSARASKSTGPTASQIRTWARAKGMQVSDRGRVSSEIRKAYEDAH